MGRRARTAVVAAAAVAVLAGCSSGSEPMADTAASAGGGSAASDAQAAPGAAPADPAVAQDAAAETRTIRTGDITVRVDELAAAATAVRGAATGLGGFVASESTGIGGAASEEGVATLVLRVPEPRTEQLIGAIVRTGELISRSTQAEDVTATIADVDSRIASQTRSLDRVRGLLARASSIEDVVLLERELAKRETELEALQARQRSLNDRADLATVTATLRLPGAEEDLGFLAGLDRGWTAFLGALVLGLTALGALVPFLLPLGLVVALVWATRRRLRRPATP